MGMLVHYLPQPTPFDPAEDPPGSLDPLGTLGPAERIAEVLMPGFTARMWRPRLLTFTALAALISERIKGKGDEGETAWGAGSDYGPLAARLGFERLFVSAIVRQQMRDSDEWDRATRRLPGSALARRALRSHDTARRARTEHQRRHRSRALARRALRSHDTPLGRHNFLKGQAINGPFGVMARLARNLGIVDEDDFLAPNGEKLLLEWCKDQELPGLLDEVHRNSDGGKWLERFVKKTKDHVKDERWPRGDWPGWRDLADKLRPDKIGRHECQVLCRLLKGSPIRARCLALLRDSKAVAAYRAASEGERGCQERKVLLEAVLPALSPDECEEDRAIDLAIRLADAYEQVANGFETAFNCLRWGLTRRGGQATPEKLAADPGLRPRFRAVCKKLRAGGQSLSELIKQIPSVPQVADLNPVDPLHELASEALSAAERAEALIKTVIARHRRVQNAKGKGMWIDPGKRWQLLPGFGLSEGPPEVTDAYLHPFRVPNAYSFLHELGMVNVEVPDEEA